LTGQGPSHGKSVIRAEKTGGGAILITGAKKSRPPWKKGFFGKESVQTNSKIFMGLNGTKKKMGRGGFDIEKNGRGEEKAG